jgi:hypothetical protein
MNFSYDPNAQYLFKRAYSLALGAPNGVGTPTSTPINALQYGTIDNPNPFQALRIAFDIEKISAGSSSKAKIQIYNLSQQSRQNIKKGYIVQLIAGYNSVYQLLFLGSVTNPTSARSGPEIITTLECGDAEAAIVFATLDKSYPSGTDLVSIINDVQRAMGVGVGSQTGIPLDVTYNNGFAVNGSCKSTLDKILPNQGLQWNVQNGLLNIYPIKSSSGIAAQVVSQATGMIGVPSNNNDFVQFTALLNPKLIPGTPIQLISENTSLNGFYNIRKSHFEGDSHDTKWQVTCECIPIPATVFIAGSVQASVAETGGLNS